MSWVSIPPSFLGSCLMNRLGVSGARARQPSLDAPLAGLKPWLEVKTLHPEEASGQYQFAEFAADLWGFTRGAGPRSIATPRSSTGEDS